MRRFRQRRMREFAALFKITEATRILDVGGTPANWHLLAVRPRVTLLNMPRAREEAWPGFELVAGDGCCLPFANQSFDIVFSNSVIEHVGAPEAQARFAAEVQRVGRRYWVQTPDRAFPLEPHLLTPFLHYLPRSWQAPVARRWTVWDAVERPSVDRRAFYIEHYLKDIRLLGAAEMVVLFPGARIRRERTLGLSKSLIAIGTG
jgi:SAM-dependent methyltransferase